MRRVRHSQRNRPRRTIIANTERLPFFGDCVGWNDFDSISAIAEWGDDISYDEFRKHTDWKPYVEMFYPVFDTDIYNVDNLPPSSDLDWAVSFRKIPEWPIYYFAHSSIEYVFALPETIDLFKDAVQEGLDEGFNPKIWTYDYMLEQK